MSAATVLRCANCGTPLPLDVSTQTVVCRYCGHSLKVSSPVGNPWDVPLNAALSMFKAVSAAWGDATSRRLNHEALKTISIVVFVVSAVSIVLLLASDVNAKTAVALEAAFGAVMLGSLVPWVFAMVRHSRMLGQHPGPAAPPAVLADVASCSRSRSDNLPADDAPLLGDEPYEEIEAERYRRLRLRIEAERQRRLQLRGADSPAAKLTAYKGATIVGATSVAAVIVRITLGFSGRHSRGNSWLSSGLILLILLIVVVLVGIAVFARPGSSASEVASMLGKFPKHDDGRLVALALTDVTPVDWFVAHWQGPAPDAIFEAIPSGALQWVLTGIVDELPVMLVCRLDELKPVDRTGELHMFVACPHSERCNHEIDAYGSMVALGYSVQTPREGVHVFYGSLKPVLYVDLLSALCRKAVELARA